MKLSWWCVFGVGLVSAAGMAAPSYDKILPSVVHIKPEGTKKTDQGSGFLIDSRGYFLTSNHVLSSDKVKVTFSDRSWEESETILRDKKSDLAIVKLPEKVVEELLALEWGHSQKVKVGQPLWAFGSPFGFQGTVTRGIVSATERTLNLVSIEDFIQSDVAINPGNSGGPLVNDSGQVVGVVTAIQSSSGNNSGVSFAVSSRIARFVTRQLIETGKVERGYVGLSVTEGASRLGPYLEVTGVAVNSPASKAGLRKTDRILSFLGEPVRTLGEMKREISLLSPGSQITMTVLRGVDQRELTFEVGDLPVPSQAKRFEQLGLELSPLTEALAQSYGHDTVPSQGLIVTDVFGSGTGIKTGDVLLQIEDTTIDGTDSVDSFLEGDVGDKVLVKLNRPGKGNQYRIMPLP